MLAEPTRRAFTEYMYLRPFSFSYSINAKVSLHHDEVAYLSPGSGSSRAPSTRRRCSNCWVRFHVQLPADNNMIPPKRKQKRRNGEKAVSYSTFPVSATLGINEHRALPSFRK
eukprot:GEZU01007256.1.p2 GENE.GEZU01007256.1~~GEZU01007256.1.p2  ORF type:complete len:113 (-),score=12.40 GEZU01007256.1:810-1148(-)